MRKFAGCVEGTARKLEALEKESTILRLLSFDPVSPSLPLHTPSRPSQVLSQLHSWARSEQSDSNLSTWVASLLADSAMLEHHSLSSLPNLRVTVLSVSQLGNQEPCPFCTDFIASKHQIRNQRQDSEG